MRQKVKRALEVIERETVALGSAAAPIRSYPLVAEEGKGRLVLPDYPAFHVTPSSIVQVLLQCYTLLVGKFII